jgi:asparagine synthase (glutamine-hydrolysing)
LVAWAAKIDPWLKLKNFKTKYLLRELAKDLLPKNVLNQPKKGFGLPLKKWFNGEFKSLLREYLSVENIKKEGLLDPQIVERTVKIGNNSSIWKLLAFEIWKKHWLKN